MDDSCTDRALLWRSYDPPIHTEPSGYEREALGFGHEHPPASP